MTNKIIFVLIAAIAFACGQDKGELIRIQAELESQAMVNDDFETMIKFTYPGIVELNGGPDKMIQLLKKGKDWLRKQGVTYDSISVGEPSVPINAGDELQCLIPRTIFIKGPKGKFKLESYSIGVSQDNGTNWTFIDTSSVTIDQIKVFFPSLSTSLRIPTQKQAELIQD